MSDINFPGRLSQGKHILLDGATGTELTRRGVATGLPLWSANALLSDKGMRILKQIYVDYLLAGAEIITANTFRAHRRALAPSGDADRAFELTRRAVDIARDAITSMPPEPSRFIAGSISTLEDCYRPDLVPPSDELHAEHAERIRHLIECDVDVILIETMNSISEALIAAKLAAITDIPTIVSFVCSQDGKNLSGDSLADAAREMLPLGICAMGVNCTPTPNIAKLLAELRSACGKDYSLVAYGNIGYADDETGWVNTESEDPIGYCNHALQWPAKIIGGCCGTTPAHLSELKGRL